MTKKQSQITKSSKKKDVLFYGMSIKRLYFLSVITFGLYDIYWFYRNFKATKPLHNEKIYPFWRAIFVIFFIWSLFETIYRRAQSKGYKKTYSVKWLAFFYILMNIIATVLARVNEYYLGVSIAALALMVLSALPLLPIQDAINYNNEHTKGEKPKLNTKWEVVITIIGFILFLMSLFVYLVPSTTTNNSPLSNDIKAEKLKMDDLTKQYNDCSSSLNERRNTVDTSSQAAVDAFNNDIQACENIRLEQNASVERYNKLIE